MSKQKFRLYFAGIPSEDLEQVNSADFILGFSTVYRGIY